jgi:DNA-binding transcriptional LysR family regulator
VLRSKRHIMELRQLKYFVAVAEELNFGRAARRVYLSQPALSQQIRKLEEDLGVTLLYRTKRRVELTEAGRTLLKGARQALMQIEQTARMVREVGGAEGRRLRVGFPEYANHTPVVEIMRTFQQRHPGVELEQHEWFLLQHTLQLVGRLRDGALDVGFLLLPVDDDALAFEHVLRIEIVAAIPEDHPLAAEKEVPIRALAGERIILFSRRFHPVHYDHIVECCRDAGFSPNIVQKYEPQVYSGPTTYRMVASGAGIGIVVPPLAITSRPPGVVFRPLTEPTPTLDLVVAWRRNDPSPNLQAFLEVIREFAPIEVQASDSKLLLESYAPLEAS